MLHRDELRIRDPFILTDTDEGCYYMYGTIDLLPGKIATYPRFSACRTYDLEHFEEPRVIFDGEKGGFWADRDFWAPEVHLYRGRYYLFGSCKAEGRCRGTHIFVSDTPYGEFLPLSDEPITPPDWECLDGTFFLENGTPYVVFCREWLQVKDGEIWAMPLTPDLSQPAGEPFMLFRSSDEPCVSELEPGGGCYVTDGPFLYRERGRLEMIWSSFYEGRYLVLGAVSDSIRGRWQHKGSLLDLDGGHAMVFTALDGRKMIALHSPNEPGRERCVFYELMP